MRGLITNSLYAIIFATLATLISCDRVKERDEKIRESIERQMTTYPQSTLRDLYKNYFQDSFGPGHIIADRAAADKYLRYELESASTFAGDDYEPTGYEGRFVRVNLSVIKDGRVDYNTFLDAFIRSVNGISQPSIEEWRKEWRSIDSIIRTMNIALPNAEQDRATIDSMLNAGQVVMHHSRLFNQHYAPHYRIIEREIFHKEILPLINNRE